MRQKRSLNSKIKLVEEDLHHTLDDKIELILILAGEKPATTLDIQSAFLYLYNDRRIQEVQQLYLQLELPHTFEEKYEVFQYIGWAAIAQDREILRRIVTAHADNNHAELGLCYGFPSTATKAFLAADVDLLAQDDEVIQMIEQFGLNSTKMAPFLGYMLSKAHLEAEVLHAKALHDYVRKFSPSLYKQIGSIEMDVAPYFPTDEEKRHSFQRW